MVQYPSPETGSATVYLCIILLPVFSILITTLNEWWTEYQLSLNSVHNQNQPSNLSPSYIYEFDPLCRLEDIGHHMLGLQLMKAAS